LVVVTDGQPSKGEDPTRIVHDVLDNSPVLIHTIGFCLSENHSLNQRGSTYYRAANDIDSLRSGLDQVLAEAPNFRVDNFGSN